MEGISFSCGPVRTVGVFIGLDIGVGLVLWRCLTLTANQEVSGWLPLENSSSERPLSGSTQPD